MFDPRALAALVLGPDLAEHDQSQSNRRHRAAAAQRRKRTGVRAAIARGLRRAAFLLERPTAGEVTNG